MKTSAEKTPVSSPAVPKPLPSGPICSALYKEGAASWGCGLLTGTHSFPRGGTALFLGSSCLLEVFRGMA